MVLDLGDGMDSIEFPKELGKAVLSLGNRLVSKVLHLTGEVLASLVSRPSKINSRDPVKVALIDGGAFS